MKKRIVLMSGVVLLLVLAGCGFKSGENKPAAYVLTEEEGCLEPILPDMVSRDAYDVLEEEWALWNASSDEQKVISGHMPGYCQKEFDDWAACEQYFGFSIPNPAGDCAFLEKATYVGMPEGFRGAPAVQASWYGTEDLHIEWITFEAGYRSGEVRVMVSATVYGDPAEGKPSDKGWSAEMSRQCYLENTDGASPLIFSDSGDQYVSRQAFQAAGKVLFYVNVVGEPDEASRVEEVFERVLALFSDGGV